MSELSVPRHPHILRREDTVLVVIDMQASILSAIHGRDQLLANTQLLIRTANILNVPIMPTVQYGQRLGGIIPELLDILPSGTDLFDKLTFSCAGQSEFIRHLKALGRHQILFCGIETHICVAQTAMDLVALGYQAHIAADGVSARTMEKHKLGMERVRDSGVLPCASEAAVFELLQEAGTPEFKEILKLVK